MVRSLKTYSVVFEWDERLKYRLMPLLFSLAATEITETWTCEEAGLKDDWLAEVIINSTR